MKCIDKDLENSLNLICLGNFMREVIECREKYEVVEKMESEFENIEVFGDEVSVRILVLNN